MAKSPARKQAEYMRRQKKDAERWQLSTRWTWKALAVGVLVVAIVLYIRL